MSKSVADRLARLLEEERTALLAGDLEQVGAMAAEKESLAHSFHDTNSAALSALANDLARNGALLAAAKDGVTTVLTTLNNQREARNTLSTYDSQGRAATISQASKGTERRF